MKKRPLGNTGCLVPPIGLGTVKFGRDQQVKYPYPFNIPGDKEAKNLLACARDLGINLLDTAPAYGNSEERLGHLLFPKRSEWVIITKVGEELINGQSFFDFSPEHTHQSIERSLRRLRTDYLDIVLVHSNGDDLTIINRYGTLDVLADLKKAGSIRAFGMSTKTVEGGLLAAKKSDVVMITYNLNHTEEERVIHYAREHNKGIFIKKAFASGYIFLGKGIKNALTASMDFIFQHSRGVTSVIAGTIDPGHLAQIVRAGTEALKRQEKLN
ncbi:MAG: aldo/keto reductase [Pseudomonadota bacterium]